MHKPFIAKIYQPKSTSGGGIEFVPQVNKHKNTIFYSG